MIHPEGVKMWVVIHPPEFTTAKQLAKDVRRYRYLRQGWFPRKRHRRMAGK